MKLLPSEERESHTKQARIDYKESYASPKREDQERRISHCMVKTMTRIA
jgi:hypothetical protein